MLLYLYFNHRSKCSIPWSMQLLFLLLKYFGFICCFTITTLLLIILHHFAEKKMGMKIVTGPEYDTFHCLSEILSLKPIQCCWTRWIAFSGLIASLGSGMSKPVTGKENNQDRRHSIQESRPPLFFSVLCISFCHPCLTLSIWSLCLSLPQLSAFVLFYLPRHLFPSLQWSHFCCSLVFCINLFGLS